MWIIGLCIYTYIYICISNVYYTMHIKVWRTRNVGAGSTEVCEPRVFLRWVQAGQWHCDLGDWATKNRLHAGWPMGGYGLWSTVDYCGYGCVSKPMNLSMLVGSEQHPINPSYFDVNKRVARFWPKAIYVSVDHLWYTLVIVMTDTANWKITMLFSWENSVFKDGYFPSLFWHNQRVRCPISRYFP